MNWAKIWRNGCESLRRDGIYTANWRKLMDQRDALRAERDAFKAALEQIRDQDYRGNRCSCSQLAFKVLNKKD